MGIINNISNIMICKFVLGTMTWINKLVWPGATEWRNANRVPITINEINEGYFKSTDNFRFFWINRAGHSVSLLPRSSIFN